MLVLAAAGSLLGACGGGKKESPAGGGGGNSGAAGAGERRVIVPPEGHEFTEGGQLVATDVQHGKGALMLAVRRRWAGEETTNTHFGAGWSDLNVVRLTLVDAETAMIWRGGTGWRTVWKNGEASFTGRNGETVRRTAEGWVAEMPHGLTLTFDADGRLISEKPAAGAACAYTYDAQGRLAAVGTGAENVLTYAYDGAGEKVVSVTGPEGLTMEYRYGADGRLEGVTNARGVVIDYLYNEEGTRVAAKDQFGQQFAVTAGGFESARGGGAGAPGKTELAVSASAGAAVQFDAQGRAVAEKSGAGDKKYEYNAAGQLAAVGTAEGRTVCEYDAYGRVAAVQHPGGAVTRVEYDKFDQPVKVTKPDGGVETFRYDGHGRLTRRDASPLDWEEYEYDSGGRVAVLRKPPAQEERYVYDAGDRVAQVSYAGGKSVKFRYDAGGRLTEEAWSTGETSRWEYDAGGMLLAFTGPGGLRSTVLYDEHGGIAAIEDSIHGRREVGKDEKPAPGAVLAPDGRLQSVVGGTGGAWRYTHDGKGRLKSVISPSGVTTTLTRDGTGRVKSVGRGTVAWRQMQHDAAGRLVEETSPAGVVARYTYDEAGRLKTMTGPAGVTTWQTEALKSSVEEPDYTLTEEYHADGSLASRSYKPAGMELKLPNDAQGRTAGVELNGLRCTYVYSATGQIERIELPGGGAIGIARDAGGRPVTLDYGNAGTLRISYDKADRMTGVEAFRPSGEPVFSETYAYDEAGNVTGIATDGGVPGRLEYDKAGQLVKVSGGAAALEFQYDLDGNLTFTKAGAKTQRWMLDGMGRPVQQGPLTWTWDAAGSLTRVWDGVAGAVYEFDAAGRMRQRTTGREKYRFGYLPGGDRLWKDGAAGRTWYAFLTDRLAGWKDAAGVTRMLVCLPGSDTPLAVCGSDGAVQFIVPDRLGSARRFLSAAGETVAAMDFGPYGQVTATKGSAPAGIFAGMLLEEGGLCYARQRYYDPQIARFISIDPLIGRQGDPGSHYTYAYAANNPLRFRDPMGTAPSWVRSPFEDTVVNENYAHGYVPDPKDPSGKTPLRHESGPFKGEPIVDRSSRPLPTNQNQAYDVLTKSEQEAVEKSWYAREAAERALKNPGATAAEVQAAAKAVAEHNAELTRLNEVGRLRYGHNLMRAGTEKGWGGANSDRMMAEYEKKMADLGADPLAHYSAEKQAQIAAERQLAADIAARDARAAGAFGRGSKTAQTPPTGGAEGAANTTGAGSAAETTGQGSKTQQVTKAGEEAAEKFPNNRSLQPAGDAAKEAGEKAGAGAAGRKVGERVRAPTGWDEELLDGLKSPLNKDGTIKETAEEIAKKNPPKLPGQSIDMVKGKDGVWRKAGEEAGEKAAEKVGEKVGEEVAEGIGSKLWRGVKLIGGKVIIPGLVVYGVISDIKLIAEIDYYSTKMYGAESDELEAKKLGKKIREALIEEIKRIAREEPERLMPMADGRMPDPNNPKDIDEVIVDMHRNIWKKKDAFDGIIKPRPTGDQLPGLTEALADARRLIATAREMEASVQRTLGKATAAEAEARGKLESAAVLGGASGLGSLEIIGLPVVVNGVAQQTAGLKSQLPGWQKANDAMVAAGTVCDAAAQKICSLADQCAGATDEQIKTWQGEAVNLLSGAAAELNTAQAGVDAVGQGVAALEKSVGILEGYSLKVAAIRTATGAASMAGATPKSAVDAAREAAERAKTLRESTAGQITKITGLADQARAALAPFASHAEAAAVIAQADTLGTGLSSGTIFDFESLLAAAQPMIDAAVSALSALEKALAGVDMDGTLSAARAVLAEAKTLTSDASALGGSVKRYQSLRQANECYTRIKPATPAPPVDGTEDEEAVVPDLSMFSESGEMKAVLTHAGLKAAFAMSKTPQPDDKKGQWFAGQSPAAGTKVKKGTAVTIQAWQTPAVTGTGPDTGTGTGDTTPPPADEEAVVPDLSAFSGSGEMKAVLTHAGLKPSFTMSKTPQPEDKKGQWFAGQSPAAGTKVKKGTAVTILAWQPPPVAGTGTGDTTTPPPVDEDVIVPDLSAFSGSGEMKAVLAHAGLKPSFAMSKTPQPEDKQGQWFAGQTPAAGTKVKKGSAVTIMAWQTPAVAGGGTGDTTGPVVTDEEVTVPDLSAFTGSGEMKAVITHAGLTPGFAMSKEPQPEEKKGMWFAGQTPAAGTKVKKGSTVTVLAWQNNPGPLPPPPVLGSGTGDTTAMKPGTMPNLTGLTLEQAVSRLGKNMEITGDEVGDKPPKKELGYTIYAQFPAAGSALAANQPVKINVKRYGSGKDLPDTPPPQNPNTGNAGLIGTYDGTIDLPKLPGNPPKMNMFIQISKTGDKWAMIGTFPPVLASPGGKVTEDYAVNGNTLTNTATSPNFDLSITVTVNGDTLTGTYTLVDKNPPRANNGGPRLANGVPNDAPRGEPKTTKLDINATRRK